MKMPPIARLGLAEARRWLLQRVAPESSLGRTLLATTRNSVLAWRLAAADRAATSIPFDDIHDREQWPYTACRPSLSRRSSGQASEVDLSDTPERQLVEIAMRIEAVVLRLDEDIVDVE